VRIVPLLRLVLYVRNRDRDPARLLFRRIVDRVERAKVRPTLHPQYLRDRRSQRRLPMINVPDRPHVHMGLRALKDFLSHNDTCSLWRLLNAVSCNQQAM